MRGHLTASRPEKPYKGPEAVNPFLHTRQEAATGALPGYSLSRREGSRSHPEASSTPIAQEGKGFFWYGLTFGVSPGLSTIVVR